MSGKFCFLILFMAIFEILEAQDDQENEIMHPGIRNSLLRKGQFETGITAYYGVFYNNASDPVDIGLERQNQQITGFSPSVLYGAWKWLNVGVIYQFMYVRENFMNDLVPFTSNYTTNSLGPQVRIKLFKAGNKTEIYLQSNVLIPLDSYIPADKITYTNQLIATRRFGYKWIMSLQIAAIILPDYAGQKKPIVLPANLFAGYLIKNDLVAFIVLNQTSDFGSVDYAEDNKYYRLNYSTSAGLGLKYQVLRKLDVSAYYLQTIQAKNNSKFNNLSLGITRQF